jgi:endonuclease/exonuclease/phosphatase (EEP) superfamily protein YafD
MAIAAEVTVGERAFHLVTVHTTSPTTVPRLHYRDLQIGTLGSVVKSLGSWSPVVVIGDFNATLSCRSMRDLLRTTGLRDSRQGFGPCNSWPTWCWPFSICIDHALVTHDICVHERSSGPDVGSDHLPVFLRISLSEDGQRVGRD